MQKLPMHLKITAGSAGALVFGCLFGWVIFPKMLASQLKKEMALSSETDVRGMWTKVPFALDFKVYVFNYTNPEEIMRGGKPVVKEVGPFYFEEWKEKVEMEDHADDDTITYKRLDTFYFKKEKSNGLTGEEVLTIPNIMLLAIPQAVEREKPTMVGLTYKACKAIWSDPQDVFQRIPVIDLLFRGIKINCKHAEFAPKAVCTALKKDSTALVFGPDNQFEFSLFGMKNATPDSTVVTVKRGINNVMEVGRVVALNGEPEHSIWRDHCNQYDGTDGTVFPPFLEPSDRLQSYSFDVCRTFRPHYQKKTSYSGIKTNRYVVNIGDFANDPELNCYCEEPDKCAGKGLMDVYKCMKAPMFASMPHFLDCDPKIVSDVVGLNPDLEQHGIYIDFEPITGTPMEAKQRIQFSIMLKKMEKFPLFENLTNTIVPIFWIEEGLALNETFVKMMKHQLFTPKRIVGFVKWLLIGGGGMGTVVGLIFHFRGDVIRFAVSSRNSAKTRPVQPIKPTEPEAKPVSVIGQHLGERVKVSM